MKKQRVGTKLSLALMFFILLSLVSAGALAAGEGLNESGQPVVYGTFSWENPLAKYGKHDLRTDDEPQVVILSSVNTLEDLEEEIQKSLHQRQTTFEVHYTGDTSNLQQDISSILDNIFQEDYLKNSISSYTYRFDGFANDVDINFVFEHLTTLEQEDYIEEEANRILEQITSPGMTPLEKIKAINDYQVLNTRYSRNTGGSPHSAYTLLKEGKGVCQAYAQLTYKMLENASIPVRIVSGVAGGEDHAWNLVKIEGEWYHLDVTWNNPTPNRPGQVRYNYFLLRDGKIGSTHTWNASDYPSATCNRYEYFHVMSDSSTHGDYIYFSNEADGNYNYLYKSKVDGSGQARLNDSRSYYITAAGSWVYFSNYSRGGHLYKIKTDGTEETPLVEEHATNLYIEDGRLYYTEERTGQERSIALPEIPKPDPVEEYQLNISTQGQGTVDPAAGTYTYEKGDEVQLRATPAEGWKFDKWLIDGSEISYGHVTLTMDADKTATARFIADEPDEPGWFNWEAQTVRDARKPWTITFNKAPDEDTVNSQTVYVTCERGNPVSVNLKFHGNEIKVIPEKEYTRGETYTLFIRDLKAQDGSLLRENIKMDFTIVCFS